VSLRVAGYNNRVVVDSTDSINVSGDGNVVTYHSGTPKIADSGHYNKIQQG
jgi:hypothetical protein